MNINLQDITKGIEGTMEYHWFENANIGLERTLFHKVLIPLQTFKSPFEYDDQPMETAILIDWLKLDTLDPSDINHIISESLFPDVEISIYLGSAHNPCEIIGLKIQRKEDNRYLVAGKLRVLFSHEMVAEDEYFSFHTYVSLTNKEPNIT